MEALGQVIMTGINGTELLEEERKFIEEENIGGVILFSKNYESPAQLAELINSIQRLRKKYPLFISVDQEGGRVMRFKKGFTEFPPMLSIANLDSPKTCFEVHNMIAIELMACGINLNLAPVCDILLNSENTVIGDRAFGTNKDLVSKFVSSAVRGLQKNGMMSCGKHFPGHGRSAKDSHFNEVRIKAPLDEIRENDFVPFVKAIKSRIDFMMIAHVIVESLDSEYPSSLSKKVQDILRTEMRFSKIIISDDMNMSAITDHFTSSEAISLAFKAGTDILIYRDFSSGKEAYEILKQLNQDQVITNQLLIPKFNRIEDCKKRNLADYNPIYIPEIEKAFNSRVHQAYRDELLKKINS